MFLQILKLVSYRYQSLKDICTTIGTLTISRKHLLCCSNLEATHLDKVIDNLELFYILLRILSDTRSSGCTRLNLREF